MIFLKSKFTGNWVYEIRKRKVKNSTDMMTKKSKWLNNTYNIYFQNILNG